MLWNLCWRGWLTWVRLIKHRERPSIGRCTEATIGTVVVCLPSVFDSILSDLWWSKEVCQMSNVKFIWISNNHEFATLLCIVEKNNHEKHKKQRQNWAESKNSKQIKLSSLLDSYFWLMLQHIMPAVPASLWSWYSRNNENQNLWWLLTSVCIIIAQSFST
jgi:hypothetical protein